MTGRPSQINKTISLADKQWAEVAEATRNLSRFALGLWFRRTAFAVNGVLRSRWRIRWNKLWEYSRGLVYGDFQPGMRVLDFGGGATIPLFYLARSGCEVLSLDIDEKLTAHTNTIARKKGWKLRGDTFDLTDNPPPPEWGMFDRVISFCVIEHIAKDRQCRTIERLASLLKPGGILELTFDFGETAPVEGAIRSVSEVDELVAASGLSVLGDGRFHDTGERFVLDRKYPGHRFTFGSLFLQRT